MISLLVFQFQAVERDKGKKGKIGKKKRKSKKKQSKKGKKKKDKDLTPDRTTEVTKLNIIKLNHHFTTFFVCTQIFAGQIP